MITIKEIADKIGVSPTTVSNVIHGNTQKMSQKTKLLVEEALIQYQYNPNEQENNALQMPMLLVVFKIDANRNLISDPFFGEILGAIELEARRIGRHVIYASIDGEDELKRLLSPAYVEGAILMMFKPDECESLHKRIGKPLVFIDAEEGDYYSINLQDYEGMKEITSYLLKLGHRRLVFFSNEDLPCYASTKERLRGYCDALKQFELEFHEEDFIHIPEDKYLKQEVFRQFLKDLDTTKYTAAVFVSDLLACEAINAFEGRGLHIPEELSITGFDDNMYAKLSRPMLTTVRQSPTVKGKEAVKLLTNIILGKKQQYKSIQLSTELIVRESVQSPKQ